MKIQEYTRALIDVIFERERKRIVDILKDNSFKYDNYTKGYYETDVVYLETVIPLIMREDQ
jgi:hypothetical protein